jgi:HlyD family secretion protein
MKKTLLITLLVAVVAIVAWVAVWTARGDVAEVTAVRVARESLNATVTTNGKVEPVEPHALRARFDSFVERVHAVEGANLRAGQPILDLDVTAARAALARAREEELAAEEALRDARAGGPPDEVAELESERSKAAAELERLRREREALLRLLAKQAASPFEVDQNKLALERAEAQSRLLQKKQEELALRARREADRAALRLEGARNEIRRYEEQVRTARWNSPIAGTLYLLRVKPGDFVRTGELLAEIADLARVRVRAFVDEPEMGPVDVGQPVEVTWDARPGSVWRGRTESVPRAVTERGSRFVGEVICSVENAGQELLPNTNVNVVIRVRERQNALVVPRSAVRQEGAARSVFVVEGGRLKRREVKLGISSATHHEILEGLREGELVALPGEFELRDGLAVRVR